MAKSGGFSSSANKKKNLGQAQFDMSGVFLEAPTVREESNVVRKQQAYQRDASQDSEMQMLIARKQNEVAGIERAQAANPQGAVDYRARGRKSRLELQMLNQNYGKLNEGLVDDVYGGVDTNQTGEMGSPIVDVPTVTPQRVFTTPEEAKANYAEGFKQEPLDVQKLGTGPAANLGGGDTVVGPAALINAILSRPEQDRTQEEWQILADLGPDVYDRNQAADRETVDDDTDTPSRPGAINQVKMGYQQKMQMMHDSHSMGRKVQELMDTFTYDQMMEPGRRSEMLQRINDGTFEPQTVADFFEGMLATHEELARRGAPSALSDVALHAMFHTVREAFKRKGKPDDTRGRDEAISNSDLAPSQSEQDAHRVILGAHEVRTIGNIMNGSMGIKPDANNMNSTIAGTIARDMIVRAFPNLFIKDNKGNTTVSPEGLRVAEAMLPMTQTLLPQTKTGVRNKKKTNTSRINRPRSSAKKYVSVGEDEYGNKVRKEGDVEYGNFDLINQTIDILDNTGFTIDQDMINIVNVLTQSMNPDGSTNIDKLIGTGKEDTGQLNSRSGQRKVKDPKTGRDKIDPTTGEPMMEWFAGDRVKDTIFNDNMDWAEAMKGNVFYYNHFLGDNNRFYIEQFTGNYHSHKLIRAALQSDVIEMYSTDNTAELNELKAGIVKKFGHNVGVEEAVRIFDGNAKAWSDMILNARENGDAVISLAAKEDGWSSVSAMVEATKLREHLEGIKNGTKTNPIYSSKFLTHVDGTGNGLAHNALQSGDFKTASLTNINPYFNAPEGTARMKWDEALPLNNDVYNFTGEGMRAQIDQNSDASSRFIQQAVVALGLDNKKNMRQFSKSPLMIFQYGAGRNLIRKIVRENILMMIEDDAATASAFNQIVLDMGGNTLSQLEIAQAIKDGKFVDTKTFKDADYIIDRMGDMMVASVETQFPMLKELSSILSSMANAAALHSPPIDLSVITIGGHRLNFGLANWEADRVRAFIDSTNGLEFTPAEKILYPQGSSVYLNNSKTGKNFKMKSITGAKEPNPYYNPEFKESPIFNPKYIPIGSIKAATQAAVLMTHSLDGINVARSLGAFSKKKDHMSIAQIFDGFLVSPKQAREFAAQLNKDFLDIHLDKGGPLRSTGDMFKDLQNIDNYVEGVQNYDFLTNNPNNSNVLLLYRAMARAGFRWDLYRGNGLMDKIKKFEKKRKAFRKEFVRSITKDSDVNYKSVKQFFWD